jgi:hypothetical protein
VDAADGAFSVPWRRWWCACMGRLIGPFAFLSRCAWWPSRWSRAAGVITGNTNGVRDQTSNVSGLSERRRKEGALTSRRVREHELVHDRGEHRRRDVGQRRNRGVWPAGGLLTPDGQHGETAGDVARAVKRHYPRAVRSVR